MELEEKLSDEENDENEDEVEKEMTINKHEVVNKDYKPSTILERYLIDSVDALQIEEENVPELQESSETVDVEVEVPDTESKILQNEESDDIGSIPEISASTYRKSKASSLRSVSTIPPEEVKERVRKEHQKQKKKLEKKRLTVKGEASAVNRTRRENLDNIKQSSVFNEW